MPFTPGGGSADNDAAKKNRKASKGGPKGKHKRLPPVPPPPALYPGAAVKEGRVIKLTFEEMQDLTRVAHKYADDINEHGAVLFVPHEQYEHPTLSETVTAEDFLMKLRYQNVPCPSFEIGEDGGLDPNDETFEETAPMTMKQFEKATFEAQRRSGFKVVRPIFANPLPPALKEYVAYNEDMLMRLLKFGELVLDGDPEAPEERRPGRIIYGVDVEEKGIYSDGGYSHLNTKRKVCKGAEKTKKDSTAPGARVQRPVVQQTTVVPDASVRGVDANSAHLAHSGVGGASSSPLPTVAEPCRVGPSSRTTKTASAGPSSTSLRPIATSNGEKEHMNNALTNVVPHGVQHPSDTPNKSPSNLSSVQTTPPQLSHTINEALMLDVPHESTQQLSHHIGGETKLDSTPTRNPSCLMPPPAALRAESRTVTEAHQTKTQVPANVVNDTPVGDRSALTSPRLPTTGMTLSMNYPRSRVAGQEFDAATRAPAQNLSQKSTRTDNPTHGSEVSPRKRKKSFKITEEKAPKWLPATGDSMPAPFLPADIATKGPTHEKRGQAPYQYHPHNASYTGESRREMAYRPINKAQSNADSAISVQRYPAVTKSRASSYSLSPVGSTTLGPNSLMEETVLESGNGNQAESNPSTPRTPSNYASASASAQIPSNGLRFLEAGTPRTSSGITPTPPSVQSSDALPQVSNGACYPSQVRRGGLLGGCVTPSPPTQFPMNDIGLSELRPKISAPAAISAGTVVEEVLDEGTSQSVQEERSRVTEQCVSETPITLEELREKGSGRKPKSHVGNINENGVLRHSPPTPGINSPMYYVGLAGSKFCCHVEDSWLNSISYNHRGGALKTWYSVPPKYATQLEKYAAKKLFGDGIKPDDAAKNFANKTIMLNPREVAEYGIPVYCHHHTPGTFVMTACRGYHFGFNHGFNIAEAVNYADPSWFEHGMVAHEAYRKRKMKPAVPVEYLVYQEAASLHKRIEVEGLEKLKQDPYRVMCAEKTAEALKKYVVDGNELVRKFVHASGAIIQEHNMIYRDFPEHTSLSESFGNGAGLRCKKCNQIAHFYFKVCFDCKLKSVACCIHCKEEKALCNDPSHKVAIVRRHAPSYVLAILKHVEELAGIKVYPKERAERFESVVENFKEEKHIKVKSTHRIKFTLSKADSMGENVEMPPLDSEKTVNLFSDIGGMDLAEQFEKAPRELLHVIDRASKLIEKSKDRRKNADVNEYGSEVETASGARSRKRKKRRLEDPRDSDDSMTQTNREDYDSDWKGANQTNTRAAPKRKRTKSQTTPPSVPTEENSDLELLRKPNATAETRTTSFGRASKTPLRFSPDRNDLTDEVSKRRRTSKEVDNEGDDNDHGEVSSIDRQLAGSPRDVGSSADKAATILDRPSRSELKAKSRNTDYRPGLVLGPVDKVVHDTIQRPAVLETAGSLNGPDSRRGQGHNALGGHPFQRKVGPVDEYEMANDNPAHDSGTLVVGSPNGLDHENRARIIMHDATHDQSLRPGSSAAGSTRNKNDGDLNDIAMQDVGNLNVCADATPGLVLTHCATNGSSDFKDSNNREPGPVDDGDGLKDKPIAGLSDQKDCERFGEMHESKDEVPNDVNNFTPELKNDGNDDVPMNADLPSTEKVDVVTNCIGDTNDTRNPTGDDEALLSKNVAILDKQGTNVEQPETQETLADDSDDGQLDEADEACDPDIPGQHVGIDPNSK